MFRSRPLPVDSYALGNNFQLVSRHLAAALVRYEFKIDLLAFGKRSQACALNGGNVYERIL